MRLLRPPRIATNFVVLAVAEMVSKVALAGAYAYLARTLGPAGFGQLELALAFVVFFTLLVDCGLSSYGAREIAKGRQQATHVIAQVVALRGLLFAGALAILVFCAYGLEVSQPVRQLLLLYGLTLAAVPVTLQWVFQGRDKMHIVAAATAIRYTVFAAGVFALVRMRADMWLVPVADAIGLCCLLLFCFIKLPSRPALREALSVVSTVRVHTLVDALRQALPIGGSDLVWALKTYAATVVLGFTVSGEDVGWFAAAHRVVISLHTFVWLYFFNLLPSLSRASEGPPEALRAVLRTSLRLTTAAAVCIGVGGVVTAPLIIGLLYGPGYDEAVPVMRILVWLVPAALISGNYRFTLIASNRQHLEFFCGVAGAVMCIALNLTFTPSFGARGAAGALVCSELLVWLLAYLFMRRTPGHVPLRSVALRRLPHVQRARPTAVEAA